MKQGTMVQALQNWEVETGRTTSFRDQTMPPSHCFITAAEGKLPLVVSDMLHVAFVFPPLRLKLGSE